ncbi:sure-like protein [Ascodesmis nigricans]|uniref:Sure-like protein n=1 Tax=Ascodesmis nigricans TaxID=341454 RepID=A0A4S2MUA1_9PEZI|nr:sure-like protein [Ascodesmis nigricans]
MHILVVNDDGPPSQISSPYVHSLVHELREAGHTVSICLPHKQVSWIGKAYWVGKTITPSYFRPGPLHTDEGTVHTRPRNDGGEEWILVDGTPASCAQIGIHHYFKEKGPIDLVVSGPNYGRNSTALFALSSGTIGGAMEAAVCGKRAIAMSYAFFSRNHDPIVIKSASKMAVKIVGYLAKNWDAGVELYTVNIPLLEGIDKSETKVLYTNMLDNKWSTGSCFEEVDADEDETPDEAEARLREGHEPETPPKVDRPYGHKKFKWAPDFNDVYGSVERAPPGNDGWAVQQGHVSITPLKANFMHSQEELIGKEVQLDTNTSTSSSRALEVRGSAPSSSPPLYALVEYDDDPVYVQPKIISALQKYIPDVKIISTPDDLPKSGAYNFLDWSTYEKLRFEYILDNPRTSLCCSYIIRKALIRKHHLSHTIAHHVSKHPDSILKRTFPMTFDFELDYAEYLDEALMDAWELRESLDANESLPEEERKFWILKPGMSDRGQGIRLFSTYQDLEEIFQEFDPDSDDEEEEEDESQQPDGVSTTAGRTANREENPKTSVITSHLRHFIAQPYLHPPLLIKEFPHKFHIRTYVLAAHALQVYVFNDMLALFSSTPYAPPSSAPEALSTHLTNTCYQTSSPSSITTAKDPIVKLFSNLPLPKETLDNILSQIHETVKELFTAAAIGQRIHFQAIPNAFEVFGIDFVVKEDATVWLLEVNAYPDFGQTGDELRGVVEGVMGGIVREVVKPFFVGVKETGDAIQEGEMGKGVTGRLKKVLDVELGGF